MANKTVLTNFEQEIRTFLDKPAGSLIYIAQRALKGAIRTIDDYDPEQAAELHQAMVDINRVRLERKAAWAAKEKEENQGRPEIEPTLHSTSADAGAVA
jgi:hypothetical protein